MNPIKQKTVYAALALTGAWPLAAQTAAPADSTPPAASYEDLVILTPFEVTSSSDNGYQATETLAGTRSAPS